MREYNEAKVELLQQLMKAVSRRDPRGFAHAAEDVMGVPIESYPLKNLLDIYNPPAAVSALAKIHELRQSWPHMVGENLNSVRFHLTEPDLLRDMTSINPDEIPYTAAMTETAPFESSRFDIDLYPGVFNRSWQDPILTDYKHGPLAYDIPGSIVRHEVGHGILNQIYRMAEGLDPRLDLPMEKGVQAAMLSDQLMRAYDRIMPFQQEGPIDIPDAVRKVSGYAAKAYPHDVEMARGHGAPFWRFHEPFAETFANIEAARDPRLLSRIGTNEFNAGRTLLASSPMAQETLKALPQLQAEAGFARPKTLAAGLGMAALPLAAMALPNKDVRGFINRGMMGAQLGGVPGAVLGVASQLIPGLH